MVGQLEEFKGPELTPEEQAFTAGYMAAAKAFHDNLVDQGIWNEGWDYTNYDHYITAMDKYFNKDEED